MKEVKSAFGRCLPLLAGALFVLGMVVVQRTESATRSWSDESAALVHLRRRQGNSVVLRVSLVEVLASPWRYHARTIGVAGYLLGSEHGQELKLYLSREHALAGIRLNSIVCRGLTNGGEEGPSLPGYYSLVGDLDATDPGGLGATAGTLHVRFVGGLIDPEGNLEKPGKERPVRQDRTW